MTAAPTPDNSQQHTADLREALQESARWLAHSAGREAATDPAYAERLLAAAEKAKAVLASTTDPRPGATSERDHP
ncbi:hypothetical protein ABT282_16000 [Streptomyces sp. NPDC000927]|uniref:hypothetical protein n=1 Tax=Streptomyces sp. NPDC000927 TaxID=3154371 RepID=UPI0033325DF2